MPQRVVPLEIVPHTQLSEQRIIVSPILKDLIDLAPSDIGTAPFVDSILGVSTLSRIIKSNQVLAEETGVHPSKVRVELSSPTQGAYDRCRARITSILDGLVAYCSAGISKPALWFKKIMYDSTPGKKTKLRTRYTVEGFDGEIVDEHRMPEAK